MVSTLLLVALVRSLVSSFLGVALYSILAQNISVSFHPKTLHLRRDFAKTSGFQLQYSNVCSIPQQFLQYFPVMADFAVLIRFKRFKSGMIVAGSCSTAISAACHPVAGLEKTLVTELPFQWAVMAVTVERVARCCFLSHQVRIS